MAVAEAVTETVKDVVGTGEKARKLPSYLEINSDALRAPSIK